jgi:hypothetical protein
VFRFPAAIEEKMELLLLEKMKEENFSLLWSSAFL